MLSLVNALLMGGVGRRDLWSHRGATRAGGAGQFNLDQFGETQ